MEYNYLENEIEDIKEYIKNNYEEEEIEDLDSEELYDLLWTEDSVTGNGSGSYTFNTWKAEEYICHNMDLVQEAYEEFGYEGIPKDTGAEAMDVTIRCYLLRQAIEEALEELKEEVEE